MASIFIHKGNLGDSPTLKRVSARGNRDGFVVANMRVFFASYKVDDESGGIEQRGGYWREVEIFGDKAESCARLLTKGARVLVIGEEREYPGHTDDGSEIQLFKILADEVAVVLGPRVEAIQFKPAATRERESSPA